MAINLGVAPVPIGQLTLDFDTATTGINYRIKLRFGKNNGDEIVTVVVNVADTDNAGQIAYKAAVAINATGLFNVTPSGTSVTIKGKDNSWQKLDYSTYGLIGGNEILNTGLDGATLKDDLSIIVTGQIKQP